MTRRKINIGRVQVKTKTERQRRYKKNQPKEEEALEEEAQSVPEQQSASTPTGDVSAKDLFKAMQFAVSRSHPKPIDIKIAQASLLSLVGEKDKVLQQAIFLHDLVDWTNTSLDEIKEEFGANVASVVEEVTSVDKGGTFDCEPGEKPSKEAINGLSKKGKLIRLSDKLLEMEALVEESKAGRQLKKIEVQKYSDAKEEIAIYGQDEDIAILSALDKALDILKPWSKIQ